MTHSVFLLIERIFFSFFVDLFCACRQVVKDKHLLSIVAVVLTIDVVILVIWQVIDPLHITDVYLPQQVGRFP